MRKLTLVDYYTSTCPPCRMLSPIIEQVANHYEETTQDVLIIKVNLEEFPHIAKEQNITSVPTLVLLESGIESGNTRELSRKIDFIPKELSRKLGFMPKNKIIEWIESYRKKREE